MTDSVATKRIAIKRIASVLALALTSVAVTLLFWTVPLVTLAFGIAFSLLGKVGGAIYVGVCGTSLLRAVELSVVRRGWLSNPWQGRWARFGIGAGYTATWLQFWLWPYLERVWPMPNVAI